MGAIHYSARATAIFDNKFIYRFQFTTRAGFLLKSVSTLIPTPNGKTIAKSPASGQE
jgi:hypothetical protein